MPSLVAKAALLTLALVVAAGADAQTRHKRSEPREAEHPPPAASIDKRDSLVVGESAFKGRPYWLALAQCGGIYFKLNLFYTDAAVHARVVKPDPKAAAEYTKMLSAAIKTATTYFNGAERFLMTDRSIERADAVLTYDPQSRAEEDRLKSVDAALAAAPACPVLYQACQRAFPKACSEPPPSS
jgi:hypothetical protein